ncbi:MAG: hypothetical protein GY851_17790, partial [bacterium]|nr:hypothetical protein [bacterium]
MLKADPVDGHVVVLSNGLVQAEVAPQIGGRLLVVQRQGGENLLRWEADYSQTTESAWTSEGSAGLSYSPARAWFGSRGVGTGSVRWEHAVPVAGAPLRVTRELAVQDGVPAIFYRVTVRNVSKKDVQGVGYGMRPPFRAVPDLVLESDGETSVAELKRRGTDLKFDHLRLRTAGVEIAPRFPGANYRVQGQGYMIRVGHQWPMGDLAAGGSKTVSGAWWFGAPGAVPDTNAVFDWDGLVTETPVERLVIRDTPPDDLPVSAIAKNSPWGLCGHGDSSYPALWRAAGVRWLRKGFSWSQAEAQSGHYDFEAMDETVAAAEAADIRLIGLITSNPSWATVDGHPNSPPKDLAQWAAYVETLTRRYRGRVHVWEIWNEPDIRQFFTGTVDDYVALLAAAYQGAKRGNPDCLVMSAGLDGPGERFLVEMMKRRAMDHCDLIGFHPYAGTPAGAEKRLRAVWRILNLYEVCKPLWVTEVGWQSGGWKEGPGVVDSEATKARYLTEAYGRLRPFAEVICWYVDREAGNMFGLVRPQDRGLVLNPAYMEYRKMTGAVEGQSLVLDGPDTVSVEAGGSKKIAWTLRNTGTKDEAVTGQIYEALPWVKVAVSEPVLAAGKECRVELTLTPPEYAVAGTIPAVLLVSSTDSIGTLKTFGIDVANEGGSCEVAAAALWGALADEDGKSAGPWTPTSRLVVVPGGYLRQPFRIYNRGSVKEAFRFE